MAGFLKKKHWSSIQGQNHLKPLRDGPLHWETAVADFLETFECWLQLDNFDNAEWIRPQWVEMFLKKGEREIWEVKKMGRQGNKRLATDLGEHASTKATTNLLELPNTTFMVLICRVLNGNSMVQFPKQLPALCTDARH